MSEGAYKRLLAWSDSTGLRLDVKKVPTSSGYTWTIAIGVAEPVSFSAIGRAADIDGAAAAVIKDLETVGVTIP
jgi:hypothetical protein